MGQVSVALGKRIVNILKFGFGAHALEKKRAEKTQKRKLAFDSEQWQRDNGLAQRKYTSYAEYMDHQTSKLDKVIHRLHETAQSDEEYFRQNDYFVTLLVFSQYITIIINERMSVVNADVMIVVEIF